jgi:hypothetical protein
LVLLLPNKVHAQKSDSVRLLMHDEIDFIEHTMRSYSVDCYRGLTKKEWDSELSNIHRRVDGCNSKREYQFLLRRFGYLINDYHACFPDEGVYNRLGIFQKNDLLLPIWVRLWHDGRVFVREDYTNTIPTGAEIISINGRNAAEIGADLLRIIPSEFKYAFYKGNSVDMIDPYIWTSFINHLFCEKITSPFNVDYELDNKIRNTVIEGWPRSDFQSWFDKGIGKESMEKDRPIYYLTKLGKNTIDFKIIDDSIAIVKISQWIGSNAIKLMLLQDDKAFQRKVRKVMLNIIERNCPYLIIDLRGNIGGYEKNVLSLLQFFIDIPIPHSEQYIVQNKTRKKIKRLLKSTYFEDAAEKRKTIEALKDAQNGTIFNSDCVVPLYYRQSNMPQYKGKLYILVDEGSYSGSILFAQLISRYGKGTIVGTSVGGYSIVSGGNTVELKLPYSKDFYLSCPFVLDKRDTESYEYVKTDISLEPSLDKWKEESFSPLDSLISIIKSGIMLPKQ